MKNHFAKTGQVGRGHPCRLHCSEDDDKLLVTVHHGLWIYNLRELSTEPYFREAPSIINATFVPKSDHLAVFFSDNRVSIVEHPSGTVLQTLKTPGHIAENITFSEDGQTAIVCATSDDGDPWEGTGKIYIWDYKNDVLITELTVDHFVYYAIYDADEKRLVASDTSGTVYIWQTENWEQIATFDTDAALPAFVATEFFGERLLLEIHDDYSERRRLFWHPVSGERQVFDGISDLLSALQTLSEDKRPKHFYENGDDEFVIWDIKTGEKLRQYDSYTMGVIAVTEDDERIVEFYDSHLRLVDLTTGEILHTFSGHMDDLRRLVLDPGERWIAAGSNRHIFLWSHHEGVLTEETTLSHDDRIGKLCFSPDGRWLVATSWAQLLRVWNTETWNMNFETRFVEKVQDLVFSPDARTLAVGTADSTIHLFTPPDFEHITFNTEHHLSGNGFTTTAGCLFQHLIKEMFIFGMWQIRKEFIISSRKMISSPGFLNVMPCSSLTATTTCTHIH